MGIIKDVHAPEPNDKPISTGGKAKNYLEVLQEEAIIAERGAITEFHKTRAHEERLKREGVGGKEGINPAFVMKESFETAREMSKEERAERRSAEERERQSKENLEAAKLEAQGQIAEVRSKLEKERTERVQDWFGTMKQDLARIVDEAKKLQAPGTPADTVDKKVGEIHATVEAVKGLMETLSPEKDKGKPLTPMQEFLLHEQYREQFRQALGIGTRETPLVDVSDLSRLPAPLAVQMSLELKKMDLEDRRLRETEQEKVKVEREKANAQRGLIGLFMGAANQIFDTLSNSAPNGAGETTPEIEEAKFIEAECRDCGKIIRIAPEDRDKITGCPYCAPRSEAQEGI